MSRFIDFTLPSTVPGRTLHGFRCVPEGQVRAVLQLSHGMVEYIDRYRPLAEYLADRGILVTGHDHLGHGASIWGTVPPSAPRRTTAILPSRTATAPYWPTCTP